ncbi:MAG: hypothetical protein VW862_04760 [Euryarchaeota archaeon]
MGDTSDLKFRHVLWPTVFGVVLISLSAASLPVHRFPPMILCLIISVFTAPLLCKITNAGEIKDHAVGVGLVCIPMAIVWSLGSNYFNIAIPFMVWVWQSASWSKTNQPPIKYGVWHGFGIAFSIIPGAMLFDAIF